MITEATYGRGEREKEMGEREKREHADGHAKGRHKEHTWQGARESIEERES